MTVAASIMCEDGMILCADTEETISEDKKGNASKISLVTRPFRTTRGVQIFSMIKDSERKGPWLTRSDWVIGIAGAGHSDWVSAFIQGMQDAVLIEMFNRQIDLDKLEKLLNKHTQDFFRRYVKSYADNPQNRPQAHMLVVVQPSAKFEREAFRINDNVVLRSELNSYLAVGTGAPAFQHLADNLLRGSFSTRQAAAIAVYILKRVKSEVPGCGGNSHILMISKNGTIEALTAPRVTELEMHQAGIESKFYDSLAADLIRELP